jgi:O-methyltransferase
MFCGNEGFMHGQEPADLYLELMKKTLSFALWPEPPIPVHMLEPKRRRPIKRILALVSRTLEKRQLQLVQMRTVTAEHREQGKVLPAYADTMIGLKRLNNLQLCVETAIRDGIPGDLIETGVWRGGACIFMRAILAAHGIRDRKVFVADSFEGLPKPDADAYPVDRGDTHHLKRHLAISQEDVARNFEKYGLLDEQVVFLKGWFKDTLPSAPIRKLAVLRLDGDMYGSTMDALDNLYPKLASGGFCVIDDYGLRGCKQAVDDFRQGHAINAKLEEVDWTGRFWRKT